MRKFSGKKLYKLGRVVVIIISLLSLWLVKVSYDDINYFNNKLVDDSAHCYTQYDKDKGGKDEFTKNSADDFLNMCINIQPKTDQAMIDSYQKDVPGALGIGLFLPIFFFGGTWIYKYIFPIQDK